jgi:hypothetical protein
MAHQKDEQGPHVAMPNTTQAAKSLDPRAEWDGQADPPKDGAPTATAPADGKDWRKAGRSARSQGTFDSPGHKSAYLRRHSHNNGGYR